VRYSHNLNIKDTFACSLRTQKGQYEVEPQKDTSFPPAAPLCTPRGPGLGAASTAASGRLNQAEKRKGEGDTHTHTHAHTRSDT
jgi:hypothetical protein